MSAIKSACVNPELPLRVVSVRKFGKLCLRVWGSIDKYAETALDRPFESTSEMKRFEQDLKDFICDLFKSFADEFTGKGELTSDTSCLAAYADVFADAFGRYFDFLNPLRRWQQQISGVIPTPRQTDVDEALSVCFSTLVSKVCSWTTFCF